MPALPTQTDRMMHAAPDLLQPACSRHMHMGQVPRQAGCYVARTENSTGGHRMPLCLRHPPARQHGGSLLMLLAGYAAYM